MNKNSFWAKWLMASVFFWLLSISQIFSQNNFLDFDGVDDIVTLQNFSWPASGGPITIEFWNYVAGGGFATSAFSNVPSGTFTDRIHAHTPWSDNRVYWDYGDIGGGNTGRISTNYAPYLNKWTHIALVSEGNGGSFKGIYLDGVLVASNGTSDGPDIESTSFRLGSFGQAPWFYYQGQMDDFRIWNDIRTATEINAYKNAGLTGNEDNLVVYFNFDEGDCGGNNTALAGPQFQDLAINDGDQSGTWVDFAENGCASNIVCGGASCGFAELAILPFNPVGDATVNGNCLDLTQNAMQQTGAAWSHEQINLYAPFTMTANFNLGNIGTNDADGIAFVLQQIGDDVVGFEGGNLGYVGLDGVNPPQPNNSLGVAFRTFTHDQIEIWNNSVSDISGSPAPLPAVSGLHPVTIGWDPNTTTLTIDFDNDGIDISWTNDIVNNYFGGNPIVFWGFTSAAFVPMPPQSVCDIQMLTPEPVPTLGEWGMILLVLLTFSFGSVFLMTRKTKLAGIDGEISVGSILHNLPFNAKEYGKILMLILILTVFAFTIAVLVFGYSLTNADIPGILVCTPVLAYLIYLISSRNSSSMP